VKEKRTVLTIYTHTESKILPTQTMTCIKYIANKSFIYTSDSLFKNNNNNNNNIDVCVRVNHTSNTAHLPRVPIRHSPTSFNFIFYCKVVVLFF
jgi:hypothetical protein